MSNLDFFLTLWVSTPLAEIRENTLALLIFLLALVIAFVVIYWLVKQIKAGGDGSAKHR